MDVHSETREALLVIDMLNDFVLEGAPLEVPDTRKILPAVRREIRRARARNAPVLFLCDTHAPDDPEFRRMGWPPHAVRGTLGALVVEILRPGRADRVIPKTSYSCFHNTELERTLRLLGITRLRLTGCVTHICVLFAAYEAALRGYDVEVVEDAVAGLDPEDHAAGLRIMKNVLGARLVRPSRPPEEAPHVPHRDRRGHTERKDHRRLF